MSAQPMNGMGGGYGGPNMGLPMNPNLTGNRPGSSSQLPAPPFKLAPGRAAGLPPRPVTSASFAPAKRPADVPTGPSADKRPRERLNYDDISG
jgi:hypothetical protein